MSLVPLGVGLIVCGANVDHARFAACIARGAPA